METKRTFVTAAVVPNLICSLLDMAPPSPTFLRFLHLLIWPLPHPPFYDFFTSWYGPSLTYLSIISSRFDMAPPSPTFLRFLHLLIWPLPHLPVYNFFTSWYGPSPTYLSISSHLDMAPPSPTFLFLHILIWPLPHLLTKSMISERSLGACLTHTKSLLLYIIYLFFK